MDKSNSNSASEANIGKLHNTVTKVFSLKMQQILHQMEQLELVDKGDLSPEDIMFDINTMFDVRVIQAAGKWVESNGVGCAPEEQNEQSSLSKRLKLVQSGQSGKVVNFEDPQ